MLKNHFPQKPETHYVIPRRQNSIPQIHCSVFAEENFFQNQKEKYFSFPDKIFISREYLFSPNSRIQALHSFLAEGDIIVGNTAAWVHFGCVPRSNIVPIEIARRDQKLRNHAKRRRFRDFELERIDSVELTSQIRTILDISKTNLEYGLDLFFQYLLSSRTPNSLKQLEKDFKRHRSPAKIQEILQQIIATISQAA
ncbi:MAG: hypothetical protein SPG61_04245 [Arcanobacterium sp.]|nr:hypothetical protein [Arcanobacterium sp.]